MLREKISSRHGLKIRFHQITPSQCSLQLALELSKLYHKITKSKPKPLAYFKHNYYNYLMEPTAFVTSHYTYPANTTIFIASLVTFLIGAVCAAVSIYMFKTNRIPRLGKNSISVDEPRQAGVLFALFSLLGFAMAANLTLTDPAVAAITPAILDLILPIVLFIIWLSFPALLLYAGFYGLKTHRVYGYINTRAAQPHIKRYAKSISILMLIAGTTTALGGIAIFARGFITPSLGFISTVANVLLLVGTITCFAMSGLMLSMEGAIKRAIKSAKPSKSSSIKSKAKTSRHN